MRFSFIARTVAGQEQRGTLDADNLETAREILRKRQLLVETIHPIHAAATGNLWTDIDAEKKPAQTSVRHSYVPLIDTFRLFAGWLLAWYGLVYLLGALMQSGRLQIDIPFVQALFVSPIILRLAFGTYLFLLLTSMHRAWGKGMLKGILLTIAGIFLYAFFHVNA